MTDIVVGAVVNDEKTIFCLERSNWNKVELAQSENTVHRWEQGSAIRIRSLIQ